MFDALRSIDFLGADILTTLVFLPTLGAVILAFISPEAKKTIRTIGLFFTAAPLALSAVVLSRFDPAMQPLDSFRVDRPWIPRMGIHYLLGIDGLALSLILL